MKNVTTLPRTRSKSATNQSKKGNVSPKNNQIRYCFVPLLQQFRNNLKKNFDKNTTQMWIPIECALLIRYEFAALSPQTRYIFVAILLYCGMRGVDEIPMDAKFLANPLAVDARLLEKSLGELESAKLLLERKKEEKEDIEKTDRQTDENGVLCVDSQNLFQNEAEENKTESETETMVDKNNSAAKNAVRKNLSNYSIDECLRYVELCKTDGDQIQNTKALARNLFKTGEADSFIMAKLFPVEAEQLAAESYGEPISFTDEPCRVCFGAKMANIDGKGYRKCERCKNERGASTGLEPEGEAND